MRRLIPHEATIEETFALLMARLDAERYIDEDGCWLWLGNGNLLGYGSFKILGESHRVHRLAFQLYVGPVPRDMDVDHDCHNRDLACAGGPSCKHRRCFNPAHLVARTRAENTALGRSGDEHVTQCPQLHAYADERNVGRNIHGVRYCKQCKRDRTLAYYHDRKASA